MLITLGVIGVVAALTMPTLIKNHQNQVYVNQLKKTYTVLSQGFQLMLADDGVDKLSDTQAWNVKKDTACSYTDESFLTETNCKNFTGILKKYFKLSEFTKYGDVERRPNGDVKNNNFKDYYGTSLPDGSIIFLSISQSPTVKSDAECSLIKSLGGTVCSRVGTMYIDVNGKKGPGINGRDMFSFHISDDGKLYPRAGVDYALFSSATPLESNSSYWRKYCGWCGQVGNGIKCETQIPTGDGCQARIMENGWKIDY